MSGAERASDALAYALLYPFETPGASYLYRDGDVQALEAGADAGAGLGPEPRAPVIAVGANRAPAQLRRKLAALAGPQAAPVVRGWLTGFDVVYSAHFTRYGAVPATLCPSPGTRVEVAVAWLTDEQLEAVHASESLGRNYAFGRVADVALELEAPFAGGRALDEAHCYVSRHGAVTHEAAPVGLSAIAARARAFAAFAQREAMSLARDHAAPGEALESLIPGLVADGELRARLNARLRENAQPLAWAGFTPLAG